MILLFWIKWLQVSLHCIGFSLLIENLTLDLKNILNLQDNNFFLGVCFKKKAKVKIKIHLRKLF
jgi:hypothetical protein